MATVTDNGANFVMAFKEFNVDVVLAVPEMDPDSETTETDDAEESEIGDIAEFVEINEAHTCTGSIG